MDCSNSSAYRFQMDYKEQDGGNNILHLVVATKNYQCFNALLRYSEHLDFRIQNDTGCTPLNFACNIKHVMIEIVEKLILMDKGTVQIPDYNGISPLHFAVKNRRLDIVALLVKYGANIGAVDFKGRSPFHYSAINCQREYERSHFDFEDLTNVDIMHFLLEHEAEAATIRDLQNETPLDKIFQSLKSYNVYNNHPIQCMESLITHTFDKYRNYDFIKIFTAFYYGIKSSSVSLMEYCIYNYYCDETLNARYHKMVRLYVGRFVTGLSFTNYSMVLFMHDGFAGSRDELKWIIDDINRSSYSCFIIQFEVLMKSDEGLRLIVFCLKTLHDVGIELSSNWFLEEVSQSFNVDFGAETEISINRLFSLFENLFHLNAGIDFNHLAMQFVGTCLGAIKDGDQIYYHKLRFAELLFAFCSDILIGNKIAEEIYDMDKQWNQDTIIDYNQILQNIERFLNATTFNELSNYCNNFSIFDIEYKVYSLKQICRTKIRKVVADTKPQQSPQEFMWRIMSLPIPTVMKRYLRFLDDNFAFLAMGNLQQQHQALNQ